jgi:hypothetical protein
MGHAPHLHSASTRQPCWPGLQAPCCSCCGSDSDSRVRCRCPTRCGTRPAPFVLRCGGAWCAAALACTRTVGDVDARLAAASEAVDEPRVHRAKQAGAGLHRPPHSCHVLPQPQELEGREVRADGEPRDRPEVVLQRGSSRVCSCRGLRVGVVVCVLHTAPGGAWCGRCHVGTVSGRQGAYPASKGVLKLLAELAARLAARSGA